MSQETTQPIAEDGDKEQSETSVGSLHELGEKANRQTDIPVPIGQRDHPTGSGNLDNYISCNRNRAALGYQPCPVCGLCKYVGAGQSARRNDSRPNDLLRKSGNGKLLPTGTGRPGVRSLARDFKSNNPRKLDRSNKNDAKTYGR
jgi:hypothetical protein